MARVILFIDSQNFLNKLETVFEFANKPVPEWNTYNFKALFDNALRGILVSERLYYYATVGFHKETPEKSRELIEQKRKLNTMMLRQGFTPIKAGRVRGNYVKDSKGKIALTFKEKGVDVRIAVDIVAAACDKQITTAIICSSDSDLQPAVKELKKRGVESIYLGFEIQPNLGLQATTKRTILIRNSEVLNNPELPKEKQFFK